MTTNNQPRFDKAAPVARLSFAGTHSEAGLSSPACTQSASAEASTDSAHRTKAGGDLPSSLTLQSLQDNQPITATFILIERPDGTGYARMSFDRPATWDDADYMGEAMNWFGHHRPFHSCVGLVQVSARVWKYVWGSHD